jgi:hypothetical protein
MRKPSESRVDIPDRTTKQPESPRSADPSAGRAGPSALSGDLRRARKKVKVSAHLSPDLQSRRLSGHSPKTTTRVKLHGVCGEMNFSRHSSLDDAF